MLKREELENPNSCLNKAKDDELLFVLLGRDAAAPASVRAWIEERIRLGKNRREDPQIQEAAAWADRVEASFLRMGTVRPGWCADMTSKGRGF